jgi:hypothetical protein
LSSAIPLLAAALAAARSTRTPSATSDIVSSRESAIMARTASLVATARTCSTFLERLESAARQASFVSAEMSSSTTRTEAMRYLTTATRYLTTASRFPRAATASSYPWTTTATSYLTTATTICV